jgi:DNA polymerase-3 subunit epsilon
VEGDANGGSLEFTVVDVETANPDLSSICQIGVVVFKRGGVHRSWSSLVNPEDYFHPTNVSVHGIDESKVRAAPTWRALYHEIFPNVTRQIVASHTAFDRTATERASAKAGLPPFDCRWLDTARVARRTWPQFARAGYGLANLAEHLGIQFEHHDAEEDARAAGEILLRAIAETGASPVEWCDLSRRRLTPHVPISVSAPSANPEGSLFGEVVVFTGAISILRRDAAEMAAEAGCEVADSVNKRTTLLVVGDQNLRVLGGKDKSSKQIKAEKLIAKGQRIRILGESDFRSVVQGPA